MDEKYMKVALTEAIKTKKYKDVPVGAVIVENGKIIAKGYNKKEKMMMSTQHAEIVAIEKACKKKKSWYLEDCILYVTLEPCIMCCGAILQSRIKKVVYATNNEKFGGIESVDRIFDIKKNNHRVEVKKGVCKEEAIFLLKKFFKDQREA